MIARDEEKLESPTDGLDEKRIEAEADSGNGEDAPSSTAIDGHENEIQNGSSSPSEKSETALPPVQKQESKASQGEEMKKSKIVLIVAALCVCVKLSMRGMGLLI